MLRSFIFAAIMVAFGSLAFAPVSAQTPDGQTPAEETVCDQLKGGTPGLYGLCVAYCEAQDFEDVIQQAKAGGRPGEKILERYRAKMTATDPDMPCIANAAACPCYNVNLCDPSAGMICDINILDVSELFTGLSCNVQDSCQNALGFADDVCVTSGISGSTAALIRPIGSGVSICSVREPDLINGGFDFNFSRVNAATAQICLNELNAYDGNGEQDPDVLLNCGLGRP